MVPKARCEARFTFCSRERRCGPITFYLLPAPEISEAEPGPGFPVLRLESLVRMKLTSFRLKDQVHLLDLLDVGLIDASWCERFPPSFAERLTHLLETRDRET